MASISRQAFLCGAATAQVLVGWHDWLTRADQSVWSKADLTAGSREQQCSVTVLAPAGTGSQVGAEVVAATGTRPVSSDNRTMAVASIDTGATAFPWRRHAAIVQWYVNAASAAAPQWIAAAHAAVAPFSAGGYVNYLEPNTTAARYFGNNVGWLASVRRKYDPGAVMYSGWCFRRPASRGRTP